VAALLLGAVSILIVSLHVAQYTKLSPIDELQHIDYLYKSPQIVAPADKVGNDALRQEACRGVDAPGFVVPAACSRTATYDPSAFQERGYNTAAGYTPLYYSITHAAALAISALTPASDLVTSARLAGALWLWAGLLLTFFAGRRLGVPRLPLMGLLILVAITPALLYASATVTPDASNFTSGALMLWLTIWWEQQPRGQTWVLALGALCVACLKMTNVVVICACAGYLLLRWWQQRQRRDRLGARGRLRDYPTAALLVVPAAVVPSFAWTLFVSTLPQPDPADLPDLATRFTVDAFPVNGLLESLLAFVNPLSNPTVVVGSPQLVSLVVTLTSYILVPGLVGAALFVSGRPRVVALGRAWVVSAIACCAGLIVLGYVLQSAYWPTPPRYSLSLVAGMCVMTASQLRHRFATVSVWVLAVLTLAVTVYRLATLP
jgi:hypothetical protein